MQVILLKGAPASGKSMWAKAKVAEDPTKWMRQNNDDLRSQLNGSVFNGEVEKLVSSTRLFIIKEAINKGLNIIIDNINADRKHWENTIKLAKEANKDCIVEEKHFYCPLEELLERNAKREGVARVPDEVVEKFYTKLGGKGFQNSIPRVEEFKKREVAVDRFVKPMEQDNSLQKCVVFDNDGTISSPINNEGKVRNPYDASTADEDTPILHTIEAMRLYYQAGYKVIFVSGREEKDRAPTERFYKKHFPDIEEYQLYMRPTGSNEKDVVIKERIFNEQIKGKYRIAAWFDDRLQIVKWLYGAGFPVLRIGDPESSF